jgi:hypothetical protein
VPEDLRTGELDFKARDKTRAEVLRKAKEANVEEKYILDRGKRFSDPVVKQVIEDYETDLETLRPYWEMREVAFQRYPALRGLQERADTERLKGNVALASSLEGKISQTVSPLRLHYAAMHKEVARALIKWGYSESRTMQALAAGQ